MKGGLKNVDKNGFELGADCIKKVLDYGVFFPVVCGLLAEPFQTLKKNANDERSLIAEIYTNCLDDSTLTKETKRFVRLIISMWIWILLTNVSDFRTKAVQACVDAPTAFSDLVSDSVSKAIEVER